MTGNRVIRGIATNDKVGTWNSQSKTLTDIQGHTRYNVPTIEEAIRVMHDDWSWNVLTQEI